MFRQEVHELFLDHPEAKDWGNPERLWGTPVNPWKPLSAADLQACRESVFQETGSPSFSTKAQAAWNQLQSLVRGTKPNAVVGRIIESLTSWKEGSGAFNYYKEAYTISPGASKSAATLVEHYLHECTEYRLREARAVHHLLSLYEKEYDAEVR